MIEPEANHLVIDRLRAAAKPWRRADGSIDLTAIDYSAVSMWLRCPKQFEFRYVHGKKSPPGIALVEGTSHHHAMEGDNRSKLKEGKALSAADLTGLFETKFEEELEKAKQANDEAGLYLDWGGEKKDKIIRRAKVIHVEYAVKYSHRFQPELVEEPFQQEVELDGVRYNLFGQTDLTTPDALWDYKTAGKPKIQKDVDNDLQLSIYSFVRQKPKVGFISFVKVARPWVQVLESQRTPGQWTWALKVVTQAVAAIRTGIFPMVNPGQIPAPWWCSEKFCGYWKNCRGKYEVK